MGADGACHLGITSNLAINVGLGHRARGDVTATVTVGGAGKGAGVRTVQQVGVEVGDQVVAVYVEGRSRTGSAASEARTTAHQLVLVESEQCGALIAVQQVSVQA